MTIDKKLHIIIFRLLLSKLQSACLIERGTMFITEEMVKQFPEIAEYIQKIDEAIQRTNDYHKKGKKRKALLKEKRIALLHTFQTLTPRELQVIYYLRNLTSIGTFRAFLILREQYDELCAFKNEVLGEEKYYDFMRCPP